MCAQPTSWPESNRLPTRVDRGSETGRLSRATPVPATPSPAVQARPRRASATAGPSHGARTLVVHPFGLLASAVCLIWLVLTTVLLVRLAGACAQLARLCKSAADAEPGTVALCQEVAALLRVAAPDVKHSPYVPGACLAGLRRPVVLLPEGPLGIAVRDVLIHELAHLVRRDGHWNLLCRLATAVFPVQPLLWKLARRLETTAEEVCDDYVVQYGSDRQAYAHRLVDIAELFSASLLAVGVVSLRSLLAHRVARILDTSRSPSLRAGRRLLTLVLVGALAGTAGVGLVGIGRRPFAAEAGAAASRNVDGAREADAPHPGGKGGQTAEGAAREEGDDLIAVRGRVVDPEGRPVGGADVYVLRWYSKWDERKPLGQTRSGPDGRFEISYRKSQFRETSRRYEQWREAFIAAFAAGYGPDWVLYQDIPRGEQPTLRLTRDDVPIEGRIVDREGAA